MVWEPKSCCCTSPRIGTLVLGWLGLIFSTLNVVGLLRYVNTTESDIVDGCNKILKDMDPNVLETDTCVQIVYGSFGFIAVAGVLGITICALLLWGVNKYKPAMMLPYMIVKGSGIALSILFGLLVLGFLLYVQQWLAALLIVVIYTSFVFLDVYLLLVVRVCHKEVKQHCLAMGGGSDIVYVEQKDALYPYKM